MKALPWVDLYFKHSADLDALEADAAASGRSAFVIDFAEKVAAPFVKRWWPALNKNGLVDDAVAALKESMGP